MRLGCCGGAGGNSSCNPCCCPPPSGHRPRELLRSLDKIGWYERCMRNCNACFTTPEAQRRTCNNTCQRNRNIVEALCYLFNCPLYQLMTTLFRLANYHIMAMDKFHRDCNWEVMANVQAPYTEMHDLEIYDSMYDRCGISIDPLDKNNMFKVLRMMFLTTILSIDQQQYLMRMLQRLNDHALFRVNLERLLKTLEQVDIKELVCSIIEQDRLCANFYSARQCTELCALYRKVASTDKMEIIRRRRIKKAKKVPKKPKRCRRVPGTQIYCVRKVPDSSEDFASPRGDPLLNSTSPVGAAGPTRGAGQARCPRVSTTLRPKPKNDCPPPKRASTPQKRSF
ncbi:uncharacterized protein LOC115629534 [Scaptodrosophila lebanonensis]|uniref:Uncharacterized protein LOC115629534 n=1 Tax=Drosophila lebanonensis TaxID=7225 RepID=A0A6J2U323_DROLE|nr:uncharacterized protein LOC115629534 [Scaptodrosophila lebanonensis]